MRASENQSIFGRPGSGARPDDPARDKRLSNAETDGKLRHFGVVGDTYTLLLTGEDTAGQFCLIDMHVPPGGGPPPHRHDFEETFTVLDGEVEATFRGQKATLCPGDTLNIPSNAPHQFHNASAKPARLLCTCSPAGQENLFLAIGVPVGSRTEAPPKPTPEQEKELAEKMKVLAPKFRTEILQRA